MRVITYHSARTFAVAIIIAAVILLLSACAIASASGVHPRAPEVWRGVPEVRLAWAPSDSAVPFTPPSTYAMYWYEMEQCTGLRGDFRRVKWYRVTGWGDEQFPCSDRARWCLGTYNPREHAIYIAGDFVDQGWVVKHEAGHALGVVGHPPTIWQCAPVRLRRGR